MLEQAPPFRYAEAEDSIKIYELCFANMKRSDSTSMAKIAIMRGDEELQRWYMTMGECPNTWRKFKGRLLKYADKKAVRDLVKHHQRVGETTSNWLARVVPLAENLREFEDVKQLLHDTAVDVPAQKLVIQYIFPCSSVDEIRRNLDRLDYDERIMAAEAIKKKLREEQQYRKLLRAQGVRVYLRELQRKMAAGHKKQKATETPRLQKDWSREKQRDSRMVENVNQIQKEKTVANNILRVYWNEIPVSICEDLGADVNVISKVLVQEHALRTRKVQPIQLKNVWGKICDADTETTVKLTVNGLLMNVKFLVSETEESNTMLLGRKTIEEAQQKEEQMAVLMKKFPEVFDGKPSVGYRKAECTIDTVPGKKVFITYRSIPQAMVAGATKTIQGLLEAGYIEPSASDWCNPLRPVLKPDGSVRLTSNMQFLNNIVEDNNYTVPHIEKIIERTQGMKYFSVIDLKDGYYQIPLRKQDREKTAFKFNNRLYQWTRMPQGFKNSPAIFQTIMDELLAECVDKICSVYLDDVIVYGKDAKTHDENLNKVLTILDANAFKVNAKKLQYRQREVRLLGAVIDGQTQRPIEEKQAKILQFRTPTTKKELQQFLGFVNYYSKYIRNAAAIAAPLYDATKGKDENISWGVKQEEAFQELKTRVNEDIAIHLPDYSKEFVLSTDACNTGIGAILQQEFDGELKVINWASKKLTPAEAKFGITEKEFFAMAWGIEHFDYQLRGRKFKVRTDHTALLAMKEKPIFGSLRLERMRERLQEYDFSIEYVKGKELVEADVVSRIYAEPEKYSDYEKRNQNVLVDKTGKWYWRMEDETVKIFPELGERESLVKIAHEEMTGHRGRDATIYQIKKTHYWPKMSDTVTNYINKCTCCAQNRQKSSGGEELVSTSKPLEKVAVDLMFVDQKQVVLTAIDYFTRRAYAKKLGSKTPAEVAEALECLIREFGKPEQIVTDNGKEFSNKSIENMLAEMSIDHHKTSVEKHESNGRIERFHRTLWQLLRKRRVQENGRINLDELPTIIEGYNNTRHRALAMTPNEAWADPENAQQKATEVKYGKEFEKGKREVFKEGQQVFVKASEIMQQKKLLPLFPKEATIFKVLENDTYLVKTGDKIFKRNHASLVQRP